MSHSSYTASERRGIIAIAFLALLLIGVGFGFTLCDRHPSKDQEFPIIEEHSEMVDSVVLQSQKDAANKPVKKIKKSATNKKLKQPAKPIRRRSPLDEPV